MAIDWRRRRPILANKFGGLSGPAIKPIALRCVYQIASQVQIPIIGIGGISTIDDVMEFAAAGASAIQVGTANYFDPTISQRLIAELPEAVSSLGLHAFREAVATVHDIA
jgi:dihydroorotate dehydrogenase (NAD+) catalytic subunit